MYNNDNQTVKGVLFQMLFIDKLNTLFQSKSKFIMKYFLYIICIFLFAIIFTVSLVSYSHLTKQTVNSYYTSSLNNLEKVRTYSESQYLAIQNICIQAAFDNDVRKIFYTTYDPFTDHVAAQKMANYGSFVNSVESLSLYDSKNDVIYSLSSDLPDIKNIDFGKLHNSTPYSFKQTLVRTSDSNALLYSYAMEDPDYILIAAVKPALMHFENYHENGIELYIADKNKNLIYSGAKFDFGEKLPQEYDKCLTLSNPKRTVRIHGTKYMCISLDSETTEYSYTFLIPYSLVMQNVMSQRLYYLTIMVLLFLIIIVISIFFFPRLNILLGQTLKKSALYDRYTYVANIKKRQQDLLEYISAQFPDAKLSTTAYKHLEKYIEGSNDRFALIRFETDNFEKLKISGDAELTQYGIANVCLEIAEKYGSTICVPDTSSSVTLIIAYNNNIDFSSLQSCAEESLKLVKEHLAASLTASIVQDADFEHFYNAYETLKKIGYYRYIYGYNSVIGENTVNHTDNTDNAVRLFKELKALIEQNSYDNIKIKFNDFVSSLKKLSIERAHLFIMRFITFFSEYTDNLNESHQLEENIDNVALLDAVANAETLDDICDYIYRLIDNISETHIKKESSKYTNLIDEVTQLIKDSFSDPAFCPDSIAESVNLSTAYLNRIYKRETGFSLSNIILETRLCNAAEMITSSKNSIKTAARKSGFINDSYFIVLFKKRFNCTPAVYKSKYEQK